MKGVLSLICLIGVVAMSFQQKYNSRFDNINVDEILSNKRVLNNYIKCILDEGPCTPDGREFRKNVPEAIVTNCAKCTDAQMTIIRKTANFIIENQPDTWERIALKFDPERKYKESFRKFLDEQAE